MEVISTIVAPATPTGQSALAIIRVSGPLTQSLVEQLFVRADGKTQAPEIKQVVLGDFAGLDQVLLTRFAAPASFTGEDLVEISCHGNPLIVKKIIEKLQAHGCRMAEPGEFSKRAFLNGKMDLLEVNALAATLSAQSEHEIAALRHQFSGKFSEDLNQLRQRLVDMLAWIEADIDFGEREVDDVVPVEARQIETDLENILQQLAFFETRLQFTEKLREGFSVVLCGKANAGKSSLFNALLGQNRALVDHEPGTTRDFLEAPILVDGHDLRLIDTAGLNERATGVESKGIAEAKRKIAAAALVVLVIDGSQDFSLADIESVSAPSGQRIVLINKVDLLADAAKRKQILNTLTHHGGLKPSEIFAVSARTQEGLAEVVVFLKNWASESRAEKSGGKDHAAHALVLSEKQRQTFSDVKQRLLRVHAAMVRGDAMALQTFDLREALNGLSRIVGKDLVVFEQSAEVDEILGQVFKRFCIGK